MGPSDDPQERARRLTATITTRLAPNGWTVVGQSSRPPRFTFTFQHPLTADFMLSVDPTKATMERTVERFLRRPEFSVIASAPRDLPHASLIRALRENARGNRWPASVLSRLALILREHDLVTPDEAEWLMGAGPSWPEAEELAVAGFE